MNIELYIANRLCDLDKSDLSIRLKRQFINPTELNTKDAQKSYTISLPSTPNNDEIFRYKNVEETDGKFALYPDARLYVNGLLILDGKFRLSEITRDGYKGNLGVPTPLTAKDVFGERKMNDIEQDWILTDWEGLESITKYNKRGDNPECIFPLVMYGLLPKEDPIGKGYSNKDIFDEQVKLELDNMPPSFNCIQLLKKLFESKGYKLGGTAMNDERLKNLYTSYKNPNDFQMDWATGSIRYKLDNWQIFGIDKYKKSRIEKQIYSNSDEKKKLIYINLFDLQNTNYGLGKTVITDPYHNIKKTTIGNKIVAPYSGLYKIVFDCKVQLIKEKIESGYGEDKDGYVYINDKRIVHSKQGTDNTFIRIPIEIMLLKNRDEDYEKYQFINRYYKNNTRFNPGSKGDDVLFPKEEVLKNDGIYERIGYPNFIDPLISKELVCGFSFGRKSNIYEEEDNPEEIEETPALRSSTFSSDNPENDYKFKSRNDKYYLHPYSEGYCFPMLPAAGYSWSAGYTKGTEDRSYSVVYSPGYTKIDKTPTLSHQIELYKDYNKNKADAWAKVDMANVNTGTVPNKTRGGRNAWGRIEQIVWLDKGDTLDVIELILTERWDNNDGGRLSVFNHSVTFELELIPFKRDKGWIKTNDEGSSTEPMYWCDKPDFSKDKINLKNFLPSNIKINDWIDNFCKAFNLQLSNPRPGEYTLDQKETSLNRKSSIILDLDKKTNVSQRANETLNLPATYDIGFTINKDEAGYVATKKVNKKGEEIYDDGGGTFHTGSIDKSITSQKSNFSRNWFKALYQNKEKKDKGEKMMELPIISDKEAWEKSFDYREMMKKKYYDKPQRFWYRNGTKTLPTDYINESTKEKISVDVALVSNSYNGNKPLTLDYEDKPDSIMRQYFMLLDNNKSYTTVECYLTPEEYDMLDRCYVKFNGDLYLVAEADGFDPLGKSKTKLKLLKKD